MGIPAESFREDEMLIQQCLNGEQEAWSKLIRKYAKLIFSIPIKRGLGEEDAADIFQSVCLSLLASLGSLREPRSLAAWLIQTTARACNRVQVHQKKWRTMEVERDSAATDDVPDETLAQLEREQLLREAVNELSPECRKLIELLFFKDPPIPYETAAAQLGLAKGSIGATRMRCLEKLRRSLDEQGFK
jgi:RNA polymerase sigma factor (sigma-70 family)